MLAVVYEATTDLADGDLVAIQEFRGRVNIKVHGTAEAAEFVPPLNAGLTEFVEQCHWFQIWRGQIISADHPDSPLTVQYEVDPDVDRRTCVQIRESQGRVRLHVCPASTTSEFVAALNPAIRQFLAGGQWFQLWNGEIVTMDDGEAAAA
jgi:hypothetical protein